MADAQVNPILRVEGLRKRFEESEILTGISLSVEEGDLVSIIGSSGCGKSTLLRCLNCLEVLDEGSMDVAGVHIERSRGSSINKQFHANAHLLRQRVGMVFQQFNLFPHLNILENMMLAPQVVRNLAFEDATAEARTLLGKVGLEKRISHYPSQLPGGQQQRAAIARSSACHGWKLRNFSLGQSDALRHFP